MAALLAGTTHCAQCVTDSVRVYVYICVCNSAGFAWGYQRPFCAWMGLLQGSLLTRRETQQGVVLMLYSRTLAEKEIGGKMSLSSNSALSWGSLQYCHSNTVSWGYSSQILYRNIIIPRLLCLLVWYTLCTLCLQAVTSPLDLRYSAINIDTDKKDEKTTYQDIIFDIFTSSGWDRLCHMDDEDNCTAADNSTPHESSSWVGITQKQPQSVWLFKEVTWGKTHDSFRSKERQREREGLLCISWLGGRLKTKSYQPELLPAHGDFEVS